MKDRKKKSGLDTPAKKSIQTATPSRHETNTNGTDMSSTYSNPTTSTNESALPLPEEVLAAAERRLIEHQSQGREFKAPDGFTLRLQDPDYVSILTDLEFCGDWSGPTYSGPGWEITTYWSPIYGVMFYLDSDRDNGVPASEAANVAAVITELAQVNG